MEWDPLSHKDVEIQDLEQETELLKLNNEIDEHLRHEIEYENHTLFLFELKKSNNFRKKFGINKIEDNGYYGYEEWQNCLTKSREKSVDSSSLRFHPYKIGTKYITNEKTHSGNISGRKKERNETDECNDIKKIFKKLRI
ncbi:hypothetical protein QAD02_020598 [Eretmocerus hayati]|uniref:Uncharacterized protein n=1 Tax=Eretmocerus hayati TaxID=131215 RepID=A0ACC2PMI5_9HYME|nr:hypothetical protein QAD02_020598 [Eretmocerus hayati]